MAELPNAYDPHAASERWRAAWDKADAHRADPTSEKPGYTIVIPPPNITGSLHMGHALNNTLQDVLVRYKRMDGFEALWVPGTDHAGIATQWVVRRQLEKQGIDYRSLGRQGFVDRVWAWKAESGGAIVNQLRRLGVSCDWSREAFTLSPELTTAVTEHFVRLYEDGLIYQGTRLINWDPHDQTALSDLEVEHEETQAELFEFAYPLSDGSGEIVVATTRPETMLGDTAVAVHPDDPRYKHLIGTTVRHPFVNRAVPIIADSILVDPEFGTGAVKVTPAHDFNDYQVGVRHSLPMINILELDGRINAEGGKFAGLDRFEARKQVKAALEELGLARGTRAHVLQLGKSQRSGAVVEPMLSKQWFVRMQPLATPALAAVKYGRTRFVPKNWENTYYAWLEGIQDWCISRQLWWGHRIPVWYCESCQHVHVVRSAPTECKSCGHAGLRQDEDVLDTWFSSALWPFSVMGWPARTADLDKFYPTSVLVTAYDIIFFWVARMMFAGIHLTGTVPFDDVYIHALVRDKNGDKMSKTKGNVVDPLEVIGKWGADAFRFTLVNYAAQGRDILWDEKRVENFHRFQTKIWQSLRFCFMAMEKCGGKYPTASDPAEFSPYETWMHVRTGQAVARVREALESYKFNEAAGEIHAFVWGEFCDWYVEFTKATVYSEDPALQARKNGVIKTLFDTMAAIARMLHPIMPFLTEEIWSVLPNSQGFVALAAYPRPEDYPADALVLREIADVQEAVTEVRRIRADMEIGYKVALVLRVGNESLRARLEAHGAAIADLCNATAEPLGERPKGYATAMVRGEEIVIPLEGVVDFRSEIARIDKVLVKVEKDVGDLEKRLSNEGFVARAPVEVVDEMREKLRNAAARRSALVVSRERLQAALP